MKNSAYIFLGIVFLVIIGFFIFNKSASSINETNSASSSISTNTLAQSNEAIPQEITLSIKNGNYYPNTITVKAGVPVKINLDSSVQGCYRSFTIRELGIAKNLRTPQDSLVFTVQQPGTYRFACSMNMGTGTLIAE